MCRDCHLPICDPRCPNADEPTPLMRCSECGEGIYEGDWYFKTETGYVCKNCLEDMNVGEILELVGEKLTQATE